MSDASLIFDGSLELCDPAGRLTSEAYWFEALTDSSFGDPQPIEVAMASLMRDGAIVEKTGDENRETVFLVKVKGADSAALDAGVAALHRATGKRTTLLFTPPDGYGPPRIWDVETSNLLESNGFDDLAYVLRNEQVFRLRLVCLPFRRGTTLIVDDAGSPPSTGGTLLDDCEDDTNWSTWSTGSAAAFADYSVDSVIFVEGAGSIKAHRQHAYTPDSTKWTFQNKDQHTGLSLDTDTGGYVSFKVRTTYTDIVSDNGTRLHELYMTTAAGEVQIEDFIAYARDADGWVRYVFPVDAGLTITALRFWVIQERWGDGSTTAYAWYDDIELLPAATTDHQIAKQLTVEGSARTTGSLHIAAATDVVPLGHVLAITAPTNALPAGFQPDGARWVTQGTTTVDATAIDGIYYTPDLTTYSSAAGKPIFDVPVGMLTPGPYTMVGLTLAEAATLTFGVQAQLNLDGTMVGPTSAAEVSPTGLTVGWQFVTVGTVYLPPLPVQSADSTTYARLLFKGAKMANVYMIPAWQVGGRAVADFSIVDCGDGTVEPGGSSSNLWIDSPSTSQPQGGWWRGPTADRANTQSAWPDAKKPGVHTFNAGGLSAYLIATEAAGPTLTLEYYDRHI